MEKRKIEFDRQNVLGEGGFGYVYLGKFEDREVAVKRILKQKVNKREEDAMRSLDHPNVIKFFHCEDDADFSYYALELCVASLDKLFLDENHPQKYKGPMPHNIEVFLQLALGLEYIHSKGFTHRDIKPQNVLISKTSTGEIIEITVKWADFGLSKFVNERGTYTMTNINGTDNWYAPEVIRLLMREHGTNFRGTNKSDVYVLALVFGYLLLKGKHIYGSNTQEIRDNIMGGKPINIEKIDDKRKFYETKLLTKMLHDNPRERITTTEVVNQLKFIKEMFDGEEKNLLQLCDIYLQLDLKKEDLIHFGIDVNAKDQKGRNALHLLCLNDSNSELVNAIQIFIEAGIDINAKDNDKWNALHLLCSNSPNPNLTDAIEKLKQSGININAKENDGWNALHLLCSNSSNPKLTDAIEKLKQSGIDVNAKEKNGWNALHFLCSNSSNPKLTDAIEKLKQSGIDINANTNMGSNALHLLCSYSPNPKLTDAIEKLIKSGIDVNAKNNDGWNALHFLCSNSSNPNLTDAIEKLKQSGIDINAKDNNKEWNALHFLCSNSSNPNLTDAIEKLTQSGIDFNAKINDGWNALHLLCRNSSNPNLPDAIEKLKQCGIDVNANTKMGRNALHLLSSRISSPTLTNAIQKLTQSGSDA